MRSAKTERIGGLELPAPSRAPARALKERRGSLLELASFMVVALTAVIAVPISIQLRDPVGIVIGGALAALAGLTWLDRSASQLATFVGLLISLVMWSSVQLPWLYPALIALLFVARAVELWWHGRTSRSM